MSTDSRFRQLRSFYEYLVPTLTDESWLKCEKRLTYRKVKKGQFLLREGQVCNQISFVNSGIIRMYYIIEGKDKNLCFFNENTYVSDYNSFLTRKPSTLYLEALEDSEVVETSYENLQLLYEEIPAEANKLGRLVAESLFIEMHLGTESLNKESIEERYLRLVAEEGWLLQRVPQYMIASYLGITPEALSRVKARIKQGKYTTITK